MLGKVKYYAVIRYACLVQVKQDVIEAADVNVNLPGILACHAIPCMSL